MVVKFVVIQHDELSVFDVIVARTTVARAAVAQDAGSSNDTYDFNDDGVDYVYNHVFVDDQKHNRLPLNYGSMLEALGEDKSQLNEPCSATFSELNKLCILLKILKQCVTHEDKTSADLTTLNRKLVELSDGCVECFRDECISFMSDLRHVVSQDCDYCHYSKCQGTIAQFIGNIKIDLSPLDSLWKKAKNDGLERAIIQR